MVNLKQLSNRSKEILILIDEKKKTYVGELSKLLKNKTEPNSLVPNAWISDRMKILIEMDLVLKTDIKGKRTKMIVLTDKGKKLARPLSASLTKPQ